MSALAALAILLKIGKLTGVCLFFAGALGATCAKSYEDRQRAAYWLAGPGFFFLWGFGVGLSHVNGVSLFSLWILGGGLASLVTINAVLYAAGKEDRATNGAKIAALVPFAIALVLMLWRP